MLRSRNETVLDTQMKKREISKLGIDWPKAPSRTRGSIRIQRQSSASAARRRGITAKAQRPAGLKAETSQQTKPPTWANFDQQLVALGLMSGLPDTAADFGDADDDCNSVQAVTPFLEAG
jgi:hypothetical protein